jgi:hypothetical protein
MTELASAINRETSQLFCSSSDTKYRRKRCFQRFSAPDRLMIQFFPAFSVQFEERDFGSSHG